MCSDKTVNKCPPSSVRNTEKQHFSSLHDSKHPRTFRDSPSLICSLGTKLQFIYLHSLPQASNLNASIQDLLEQIVLSSLSARITVGFKRLESHAILLHRAGVLKTARWSVAISKTTPCRKDAVTVGVGRFLLFLEGSVNNNKKQLL